jgi:hypothetical protein
MVTYLLRIKGFSPETLPLGRLGEYLAALAELLGPDAPVHFDKVTKGSAKLRMKVMEDSAHQVETRVRLAPAADPENEGRRGYERIQRLLCEDKTSAEFRPEKGAVILQFPGGRSAPSARTASIREYGELLGRIIRVGGKDATVPIGLQVPDGSIVNCTATVDQARLLKSYLLEPTDVLLTGVGRWTRDESGQWDVSEFKISDCTPVRYEGFDTALAEVRKGGSGWDSEEDFDAALHRIRYGD